MSYATDTTVSVSKSQSEIQDLVQGAGASCYGIMASQIKAEIMFRIGNHNVRFVLPLPDPKSEKFTRYRTGQYSTGVRTNEAARKAWEQACRSRWRALKLCIRAKLEAVEAGITTFEEEFLAHIVTNDGRTVGSRIIPELTAGGPLTLTEGAA